MERRVEQADGHRQAGHRPEDPLEVALLEGAQLVEVLHPVGGVLGHDHALHDRQAVLALEHVLGAAEADALGAELPGAGGVLGRVGVGAHRQGAGAVGPSEDRDQGRVVRVGRQQRGVAGEDGAAGAVDRDPVALAERLRRRSRSSRRREADGRDPADGRLAHADGDDGRVARLAAARGEDALGRDHPVEVVGRGLVAHQDHRARPPCPSRSASSAVNTTAPVGGARRGGDAPSRAAPGRGAQVELGQQQLAHLVGVDQRHQRLLLGHERPRRPGRRRCAPWPARCACRCASAACRARRPRW